VRRIAHIFDLHFCCTDPAVVDALAAELNADPPDLVAVSGDLTRFCQHSRQEHLGWRARSVMGRVLAT
jgi:3',5'-cyclic AMP phosphodiesterase CpdA